VSQYRAIADAAFVRLRALMACGDRCCGAPGHTKAQDLLRSWSAEADTVKEQAFDESFFGAPVTLRNFWSRFEGERPGRIMLVSHYDARPWADRDPDEPRACVPGANDGGSGVVLLAELMTHLKARRDRPTVDIVFTDAEDWHEVDGKALSIGARRFVDELPAAERPDFCLEIDMVAGRELMLDVDVSCQEHDASYALTLELFQLGRGLSLPAFNLAKKHPYKWIDCDHIAFMRAGIASALFMDLDYREWHTRADTIDACDPGSLAQVAEVVLTWIYR
jgi:glutaminyl-peptide cyclotransferase